MKKTIQLLLFSIFLFVAFGAKQMLSVNITTTQKTWVATDSGVPYLDIYNYSKQTTVFVIRQDNGANLFYDSAAIGSAVDSLSACVRTYHGNIYVHKGDTIKVRCNLNGNLLLVGHF